MAKSDAELVQASLRGDPKAFEELIQRYQRMVFSIVYHYLGRRDGVEDLAQDVFLKVFRSLRSYDTSRPIKAWISRITANRCLDHLRRIKTRKTRAFADLSEEEQSQLDFLYQRHCSGGLNRQQAEGLFEILSRLIEKLPEKDRMAFVLRVMEGEEYASIAALLETSEVAVRIRVSRARKRIVAGLEGLSPGGGAS